MNTPTGRQPVIHLQTGDTKLSSFQLYMLEYSLMLKLAKCK